MKSFRPEDYKKFFTSGWRLTGLNASFILGGSCGKGDLLVIATEKVSDVFINREKEELCLQAGVELYGNVMRYQKYLSEFKTYVEEAEHAIVSKYKAGPEALTKQEFEK